MTIKHNHKKKRVEQKIKRKDHKIANKTNEEVNQLINSQTDVIQIDNSNIKEIHLGKRGLHLNEKGNAILARNIGQIVETIQSIPRYFYGLFAIDLTNKKYQHSHFYQEACRRFAAFTGKSYVIGVTVSSKPVEIYALFGGQWPHSSYMVIIG